MRKLRGKNTRRMEMKTRKAAVAGMFYPGDREELKKMINGFLKKAPAVKDDRSLKAIIVPHAGYIYSGLTAAYAYALLEKYKDKEQKIILLGPSHFAYLTDVAADKNDFWETLLETVKIVKNNFPKLTEPHLKEHCLEVQVPFLQAVLKKFEVLPLVAGDVDPKKISPSVTKLLDNNSLLVISSDLSHYHDYDTAVKLDKNTNSAIGKLDYDRMMQVGEACGILPILTAIDIAKNLKWKPKLLDYRNSGDTAGTKDSVVGYASFAFF